MNPTLARIGDYDDATHETRDVMSKQEMKMPLESTYPLALGVNQYRNPHFKIHEKCNSRERKDFKIDSHMNKSSRGSAMNEMEKENVPIQKSKSEYSRDCRGQKIKYLDSYNRNDSDNHRNFAKGRLGSTDRKENTRLEKRDETTSNHDDDKEIIEIFGNAIMDGKVHSTTIIDGRINPAIPTFDIINYPPEFDVFNDAKVSFRSI